MSRKVYGSYQQAQCPFCGKVALAKNEQGVPVCNTHKKSMLQDMKCVCGSWLDVRPGKYGAFALCERCGPMSLNKAYSMTGGPKEHKPEPKAKPKYAPKIKKDGRETVITSDELDFL